MMMVKKNTSGKRPGDIAGLVKLREFSIKEQV